MPANLSIRNARFEYRSRFTQAITDYRAVCDLYGHARVPEEISQTLLSRLPADVLRRVVRHLVGSLSQADALLGIASPLRPPPAVKFEVCVRVRPLWSTEAEDGEYDAISIDEDVGRCCVHDGKAARDMSTYTLHREFALDRTFGANTDEGAMHSQVVGPLLQRVLQGGRATLILFGQTGTGKTHTAHHVQRYLAQQLFATSDATPPTSRANDDEAAADAHWAFPPTAASPQAAAAPAPVVLEVFELRGKKAFDLLAERKTVRLVTAADEDVHVLGGTREEATDAAGLLRAVERAHALRSVAATERNAQSSRSHAVCRLRTHNGGLLTLVDLAGSERNDDVSQHNRTATRESADINISLQTLKECFRATFVKDVDLETFVEIDEHDIEWTRAVPKGSRATRAFERAQAAGIASHGLTRGAAKSAAKHSADGGEGDSGEGIGASLRYDPKLPAALKNFGEGGRALHMPYRRHQLTMLLKDCFVNEAHRTVVFACCSPAATDVEHSWRTLQQVCQMRGADMDVCRETRVECARTTGEMADLLPFKRWPAERVRAWLTSLDDELVVAAGVLPEAIDGKELLRWPVGRIAHTCYAGDYQLAQRLYDGVRAESARVEDVAAGRRVRVRGLAGRINNYTGPGKPGTTGAKDELGVEENVSVN